MAAPPLPTRLSRRCGAYARPAAPSWPASARCKRPP